jgi:2-oxo-4-hydroxy-4-carboxy-5-ureidoimidazoline decarboxylase
MITLGELNLAGEAEFVAICGPFFEHSPWIARRAYSNLPFASRQQLHDSMCGIVAASSLDEQLALITAHPDLVGRLAKEGRLTSQSTGEQMAAGLSDLLSIEVDQFDHYNALYRERFGFPFVICARENRKEAILASFPKRLENDRPTEIATALEEIFKIAKLRLFDAISES